MRCELFKDVGGILEADPHLVPAARFLPFVDALQLELLAEMGAEVVHPVAVRRARRGRLLLVVRALEDEAPADGGPSVVTRRRRRADAGGRSKGAHGAHQPGGSGVDDAGGAPVAGPR